MAFSSESPEHVDVFALEPTEARWQRLWLRMLTRNLWLISGGMALVLFVGSVGIDLLLLKHQETPVAILLSNGLVALLAFALVFSLLAYGREQRRLVEERTEALQEVNHHIRNALQALAFAAATLQDRKESAAISEAITRIRWALSEVLPRVEPTYEPFEGSVRGAARHDLPRDDPGQRA